MISSDGDGVKFDETVEEITVRILHEETNYTVRFDRMRSVDTPTDEVCWFTD